MTDDLAARFATQDEQWRDPASVVAQWAEAAVTDPRLLAFRSRGAWWETLFDCGVMLVVSREYEHLVLAIAALPRPSVTFMRLPHPSGVAFDAASEKLYVASTRNPNQIIEFARAVGVSKRRDRGSGANVALHRLVPVRTWFLPGCTYLHDLGFIGGRLHANAVGLNAVMTMSDNGPRVVWWPRSVERNGQPISDRNLIQLNSIAGGDDLAGSYFSASGERPERYRPGHPQYPVDRRGVVFSGATREPIARGLTRPHSARLRNGVLWVENSGYGELCIVRGGCPEAVARFQGWTRGLAFAGRIAFAGSSRVLPRFAHYAPGLEVSRSRCAIHAVNVDDGRVLGSLEFPSGNQVFAIETIPADWTTGFPFSAGTGGHAARELFYAFQTCR
ncbi:MAG: DUF4915 domain-containing protein [Candidatus Eremiobacteraeota bacterium]|nr:DUF4915 domain-containing protein [Candidatus Eremiobacteraeota bacterium]